ncbi:major facilitator superfamily domain-containing protein [Lipomyces chichibuensis]|uniref:major facilitator superfamily domain-containing protein n=1 Tax=Lipomyces chichibuensis TaxID=1546026 RepID=UPI0033437D81
MEEYRPRELSSNPFASTPYRDDPDGASLVSDDSIGQISNSKWWRRPSIYLLLPAYLVYTIAQGALITPILNSIFTLVCRAYYMLPEDELEAMEDIDTDCQTADMNATVSQFTMIIILIQGIMGYTYCRPYRQSALVSPKLGALSDRIGRRPILAMAATAPLVSSTILAAAMKSASRYAYRWLLVMPILEGLSGSLTTMMLTAHAYATDCTPPVKRANAFALFRACLFCGMALGPAFGGMLIKLTDNILSVIYVTLVMQALFILFILFVLPESLSQERIIDAQELHRISMEFDAARPRDMRYYLRRLNFLQPLRVLWPNDGTRLVFKQNIVILTGIDAVFNCCTTGAIVSILLYAEYTFQWSSVETGFFISLASVFRAIALLVLLPSITYIYKRWHPHAQHEVGASKSDIFMIRISVIFEMCSSLLLASATNGIEFAIGGSLGALGSLESPTVRAALTKHVPTENTGAVLGALSLMQSLSEIVGPIIFSNIYAATVVSYPKAIFVASIFIYIIAFVMSLLLTEHLGGGLYDSGDGLDIAVDRDQSMELELENGSDTEDI